MNKKVLEVVRNWNKELEVFARKAHEINIYKYDTEDEYGPELLQVEVLAGYEISKRADDLVDKISELGDDNEIILEICTYLTDSISDCITRGAREVCQVGSYMLYSYVVGRANSGQVINEFKKYVLDEIYQDNEELNKLVIDTMMLITQTFEFFKDDKAISDFLITVNSAKTNLLRLEAIDKTYSK